MRNNCWRSLYAAEIWCPGSRSRVSHDVVPDVTSPAVRGFFMWRMVRCAPQASRAACRRQISVLSLNSHRSSIRQEPQRGLRATQV